MKHILSAAVILFVAATLHGQVTDVQTFTYESTTRDTVISFPQKDHNEYERILMHYSMRCKDALVSTGSQRNLGCGEWDYSCNTYIVDSTRVDSLKAVSPDHVIPGFSGDMFDFRWTPTYTYFQREQQEVEYLNIINSSIIPLAEIDTTINVPVHEFGTEGGGFKTEYILKASDLIAVGLEEGDITGMSFNYSVGNILLQDLKVAMTHTNDTIDADFGSYEWTEVYFLDTRLDSSNNELKFYENFEWDGMSSIAVRVSYEQAEGVSADIKSIEISEGLSRAYRQENNRYAHFGSSGHYYINGGFESIEEEITISFWQFGADNMPVNSTLMEGRDEAGRRQVNTHLPWGNGQVYWDCGNDGGGYDRINRPADPEDFKGQWNHWSFVKNATSGDMAIYLNGTLWHSGTGMYRSIDIKDMNLGAAITSSSLFYYGYIDDFRVYNKALSASEIMHNMTTRTEGLSGIDNSLVLSYDFNQTDNEMLTDASANNTDAKLEGVVMLRDWRIDRQVNESEIADGIMDQNLQQGLYYAVVTPVVHLDSIENLPQRIDYYSVEGTDLVLESTAYLYSSGTYPIYNDMDEIIDEVLFPKEATITINELEYYSKSPMTFELMSFVTPYGIGIDFGEDGHTWTFDVTEFGPVLKGDKRLFMSRGGQWQEDMDIRFEFIEGTPDRDVIDIQQIWPVTHTGYGAIANDDRFEPRTILYDPSVSQYIVKSMITGHGQEGEFIPRNHSLDVGGFVETWAVWKECADNPIYPQGGTWVYDRAGWCPGAPTDVRISDITEYLQFLGEAPLDYGVQTASGDSRYIVNFQLIEYGPPNKTLDASIHDVIYPSQNIEYARFNPTCREPVVILKNNGSDRINSAVIEYGVVGKSTYTYDWTGSLAFLGEDLVILDMIPDFLFIEEGDMFYARIKSVNGTADSYQANDSYVTEINPVPHYEDEIVIEFRTNFQPLETSYSVVDDGGQIIHARTIGSLAANTVYRDTLRDLNGCYRLIVEDRDDDGLSWWANNDGNGYLRMKSTGGSFTSIATDFGKFVDYSFSAGMLSSTADQNPVPTPVLYPNPSKGQLWIKDVPESWSQAMIQMYDGMGRLVLQQRIPYTAGSPVPIEGSAGLTDGMYLIHMISGQDRHSVKWVKSSGEE